jgi:hypothetical protein
MTISVWTRRWSRIRQKFNSFDRVFQIFKSVGGHSQMSNNNALSNDDIIDGREDDRLQCQIGHSIVESEIRNPVEKNEGGGGCARFAKRDFVDWRFSCGFIRHGVPHLWNEARKCWLPVKESSLSDAFSTGETRAPSV